MVGGFGHSHRDSSRTTRGRRRAGVALTGLLVTLGAGSVTSAYAAAGDLSFVAGNGTPGPATEGPATNSSLKSPAGVAVDAAGNVYIADKGNNAVEKVTAAGQLSVFAGNGTPGAATEGPATSSPLNSPAGVAVDAAGNVYIADTGNNVVEKVTAGGQLSVFAGNGTPGAATKGPATDSSLFYPFGVAVDAAGKVYIADTYNHVVEKVTAAGQLSVLAGNGTPGAATEGPATNSPLNYPTGVAVDAAANVYIADYTNSRVEKVTPAATVPAAPTGLTATPGNGSATLTFTPGSDGGAAASFESSTDGTAWQALPTTGPDADGALTGTVAGLTNGTAYTVAVRAVNIVGAGAPSASTTVTPAPAVVLTPIQAKYAALGGPTSFLGASVGPEFDTPGGRAQRYEHGHIYWSAGTGAHEVHGTILEKFVGFGGVPSFLGYPVTDETGLPGGAVSAFTGGSVYWSPSTGAFEVHGLIGVHYRDLGGPAGLGYPVTDETTTPDGAGRYNHFTGGSIYWTPATGAHEVHGAIRARWAALGWEQGLAGYPVTDETDVPGVPGARMSVFAGTNAAIYWSPATGAHEVYGSIRAFYTDRAGGPAGRLGLPTSGEYATQSGRASNFTHGRLDWNARTGAVTG